MKIFRMLKRFKNLESIESAIANAQTELNKTLTQSASVKDEYECKTKELNRESYRRKRKENKFQCRKKQSKEYGNCINIPTKSMV